MPLTGSSARSKSRPDPGLLLFPLLSPLTDSMLASESPPSLKDYSFSQPGPRIPDSAVCVQTLMGCRGERGSRGSGSGCGTVEMGGAGPKTVERHSSSWPGVTELIWRHTCPGLSPLFSTSHGSLGSVLPEHCSQAHLAVCCGSGVPRSAPHHATGLRM